jgi:hypothetical protein
VQAFLGLHRFTTCLRQSKNAPGVFVAMLYRTSITQLLYEVPT